MIVLITDAAEADLEAIADWIGRDTPSRALTLVAELREACMTIAQLPEGYAQVPRYKHSGVRRRVFGNYLIFYRIIDRTIEVLHVTHGARDYDSILFPEG